MRTGLIVVAVAGALGLCAAVAWAGRANDAVVAANDFIVPQAAGSGTEVGCPLGQRVTGGGVGVTDDDGFHATVDLSGPLADDADTAGTNTGDTATAWTAFVSHNGANPLAAKVFALCSASSDAKVVAHSFTLDSGEVGGKAATCPAGQRALGGGVGTTGPETQFTYTVLASGPRDAGGTMAGTETGDVARSWYAVVTQSNLSAEPRKFKVFALCSADSHAKVVAHSFSVLKDEDGHAAATCPDGSRVVGGGIGKDGVPTAIRYFLLTSAPRDETKTVADTDDGDVALSWYANVANNSSHRKSFKTFAICEPD
jgi:hypothetical protein